MLASYSASDGSTALASISTERERAMARSRAAAKSPPQVNDDIKTPPRIQANALRAPVNRALLELPVNIDVIN
jgi:hypothetical protein